MRGLRAIRDRKGLKLREVEELTGVDLNTISRYERGVLGATVETAQKIAKALDVSVDELVNGPDEQSVIEVSLKFTSNLDMKNEVIDMAGTKGFALTMSDDGFLGIAGAAKIETREQLEAAFSVIKQRLEEGFAFQVSRGISREV